MAKSSKKSQVNEKTRVKTSPIAIIGISSLFPKAETTQQYWENILQKIDCVTDVPASRWEIEDYYDPDPSVPDKTYCKRGGFIPDIDFDPMEFGLPPNILEVTDVSQLISLVVAKDALEDAGYGEENDFDRSTTGVVLGMVGMGSKLFTPLMTRLQYPVWEKVLLTSGVSQSDTDTIIEKIKLAYVNWEENSFPGAIGNVVAGRICNRFNLGGVNCVVDAACASSLAAIRMAVGELIEGRADMMITGGVDTDNTINTYMCFSKTPAFSKSDRVRTFDADSDGMMVGEGLGMLVLKRLEDAERDGDRIYAVIKAIGTSSDGRFKSIYAPRPFGQSLALERAYAEAGFSPDTVGLIEAHGTGTMAGDPAEFQGLNDVFGKADLRKQHIALGSVKSQIAHTKAAAGAASLIKVSLALHHKILPATINVKKPNPRFDIENTPFYLNTETRPWIRARGGDPRRAGVSSFGFGGTNYHVVLEEYKADHLGAYRLHSVPQPVLLAAESPVGLLAACRSALEKLQSDQAGTAFNQLVKASRSLTIQPSAARVGFTAATVEEARQALQISIENLSQKSQLESWDHPKGVFYRQNGIDPDGKVVALFSGQGSQYLEMGRELAVNFPVIREVFGAVDELFVQDELAPLSSYVYPIPVFDSQARDAQSEALTRTEHAQPAIGSISVGLFKLLQQAGFEPDFAAGHSFGELTALWAAGVLNDEDYFALAKARGKAMSPPADPGFDAGAMMAVKGNVEQVRAALKDDREVTLANWNSNEQVVIAGARQALESARSRLEAQGMQVIPLPVSAAFHTPLVAHAQKPFAQAIKKARFNAPRIPIYANSTGQAHSSDPQQIRAVLADHILNPVLFRDEIENIYTAGGSIFVEFGPKNVLTNLVGSILAGRPHVAVALNANAKKDSDRQLRDAVMQLRVIGVRLPDFDPYQVERKEAVQKKKSPVTVKINAGYYRTDKSLAAFQNALTDGFRISQIAAPVAVAAAVPAVPTAAAPVSTAAVAHAAAPSAPKNGSSKNDHQTSIETNKVVNNMPSSTIETILGEYQNHQTETIRLHEQYLRMEEEYARAFTQLAHLQSELVSKASGAPGDLQAVLPLFESLERSMTRFHEHQAETLRVHQRYLENQERISQAFMQGMQGSSAPAQTAYAPAPAAPRPTLVSAPLPAAREVAPPIPKIVEIPAAAPKTNGHHHSAPVSAGPVFTPSPAVAPAPPAAPVAAPAGLDAEKLKTALLQIVSDKTGYPVETLELEMDMEADLGIDSIKRVEILGAMQTEFPQLPKIDNAVLAELRTLGQIVDQMGGSAAGLAAEPVVGAAPVAAAAPAAPAPAVPAAGVNTEELTRALLNIVSDKTGYPVETLELEMDMEADLGIDSIKRVEILGAMQTEFPGLPKLDNNVLAELRTLGQIVAQMDSQPSAAAVAEEVAANAMAASAPAMQTAPVKISGVSPEILSAALLSIVSDKTGYPVETLEMEMDMEADLGIDSIKRVEILGAMQTEFPQLPKVGAEVLAELRTLGQIVSQFNNGSNGSSQPPAEVAAASPFDLDEPTEIDQGQVIRKILPPPDALDFRIPAGHVCLLTDNGMPITAALATGLLAKGWPVAVLRFPSAVVPGCLPLPVGAHLFEMREASEEALQSCLAEVMQKHGKVAAFIHLGQTGQAGMNPSGQQPAILFPETEKLLVKLIFLAAKHLKQSLNSIQAPGRAAFMTVTQLDGACGLGPDGDFNPISGGLFGLVKTLNLEWEPVFCRAIDLHPALPVSQSVANVLAELYDPNRLITEVGYTVTERSTLVLEAVPVTGSRK